MIIDQLLISTYEHFSDPSVSVVMNTQIELRKLKIRIAKINVLVINASIVAVIGGIMCTKLEIQVFESTTINLASEGYNICI